MDAREWWGMSLLAEVIWCAKPNGQIDLPEKLDMLAWHDSKPQSVGVQDVEAATSVHQHLGEPRVADDEVGNQRVLPRIWDAIRVVLTAEDDGLLRPVKEGRHDPIRSMDLVPLALALAGGHVHQWSLEDEGRRSPQ
jgi:hypothetical protein